MGERHGDDRWDTRADVRGDTRADDLYKKNFSKPLINKIDLACLNRVPTTRIRIQRRLYGCFLLLWFHPTVNLVLYC